MTIQEVSRRTGLSPRTLRYYDRLGLLPPARRTESGYRQYDETCLARLQQILLYRELRFPLKVIRQMLENPAFDQAQALRQQIALLTMEKQRLESIIALARTLSEKGENSMDFTPFDREKQARYAAQVQAQWGDTDAWKEFQARTTGQTPEQAQEDAQGLMAIFAEFGRLRHLAPDNPAAQAQAKALQTYITDHYYTCTREILFGLGQLYSAGGEMTANIDAAGGPGTAAYVTKVLEHYCA